jgi:hypothetical protein
MTNDKLVDAYREAMDDYEAAKAGSGNRVETFTRFLVAERVLSTRFGRVDLNLGQFRNRYSLQSVRLVRNIPTPNGLHLQ